MPAGDYPPYCHVCHTNHHRSSLGGCPYDNFTRSYFSFSVPLTPEAKDVEITALRAEVRALREAVQTAYGYLWCANNEPGTPHRYSSEKAAYEARKVLRDLLTNEQRGAGINAAIAVVRAKPLLTGEPGPGGEG